MDFVKAVEEASRLPEDITDPELPDIFGGMDSSRDLYSRNSHSEDGTIPGTTKYDFSYSSARLTIGKETTGFENGCPLYTDIDESSELKFIMDNALAGKYVLLKKEETFLKDGTIVVWIEWAERKPKALLTSKGEPILTEKELRSPELVRPVKGLNNSEPDD